MNPSALINRSALVLAAVIFGGCSQVVRQSYEGDPASSTLKLAAYSGRTTIFGSTDPRGDSRRLVADGYARLGQSKFNQDGPVTKDELLSEASDVGADIVLFSERPFGSGAFVTPMISNDAGVAAQLPLYMSVNPAVVPGVKVVTTTAEGSTSTVTTVTSQTTQDTEPSDAGSRYIVSFWRRAPID